MGCGCGWLGFVGELVGFTGGDDAGFGNARFGALCRMLMCGSAPRCRRGFSDAVGVEQLRVSDLLQYAGCRSLRLDDTGRQYRAAEAIAVSLSTNGDGLDVGRKWMDQVL